MHRFWVNVAVNSYTWNDQRFFWGRNSLILRSKTIIWSLWFAQIYVACIIHFFFWTHSLHCNYALGKQVNNMKSKHGHIQNFCYSKTLNAPFHLQKTKNNCNWGWLQRRVLRRRSDCGLCETPIGTSPATLRRFCWVGFVSLTQSSFEAPCHTYSSIYMTIYIYICKIYINIYSQVQYIFWNNLPTKPATRFGSCVSSAEPDSSCSVLDGRVPSAVVSFTCTIQSNLYKLSKHKCSKHHHLGSQQ